MAPQKAHNSPVSLLLWRKMVAACAYTTSFRLFPCECMLSGSETVWQADQIMGFNNAFKIQYLDACKCFLDLNAV